MRIIKSDKRAWDNLIDMDKRTGCAYTVDVLQKLMGEDAFRDMYIKQTTEFSSFGTYVDSQAGDQKYSFVVVHELS